MQHRIGHGAVDDRLVGLARQLGAVIAQQDLQGLVVGALDDQVGELLGEGLPPGDGAQVSLAVGPGDLDQVLVGQGRRTAQDRGGDIDGVGGQAANQGARRIFLG